MLLDLYANRTNNIYLFDRGPSKAGDQLTAVT